MVELFNFFIYSACWSDFFFCLIFCSDCGMFTICFAEHVLHQKFSEIPNPFPIVQYRKKMCVNLYMHARDKQLKGYESDVEKPGRFMEDE